MQSVLTDIVNACHNTLHVRRWVAKRLEEMFVDNDIAEDTCQIVNPCLSKLWWMLLTLIIPIKDQNRTRSHRYPNRQPLPRTAQVFASHDEQRLLRGVYNTVERRDERGNNEVD